MDVTPDAVRGLITPTLEARGTRLCGVKVSGRASRPLIQVFVDWEEGGITIDACADLTRSLLDLFDAHERFAPDYRLEVSSPGIDWPLTETWQFRKNIGRTIRWKSGDAERQGRILDVLADGGISVETDKEVIQGDSAAFSGAKVTLFPKSSLKSGKKRNEARSR